MRMWGEGVWATSVSPPQICRYPKTALKSTEAPQISIDIYHVRNYNRKKGLNIIKSFENNSNKLFKYFLMKISIFCKTKRKFSRKSGIVLHFYKSPSHLSFNKSQPDPHICVCIYSAGTHIARSVQEPPVHNCEAMRVRRPITS